MWPLGRGDIRHDSGLGCVGSCSRLGAANMLVGNFKVALCGGYGLREVFFYQLGCESRPGEVCGAVDGFNPSIDNWGPCAQVKISYQIDFCAHVVNVVDCVIGYGGKGDTVSVIFFRLMRYIPVDVSRGPVMVGAVGYNICTFSLSNQQQ